MFANLRLMIVALSASLFAIVCAMSLFMGMFAAFNVAHESFSGLAPAKPPLQLAYADEISAPVADGKPAPFGVRFQLNARQIPGGPVIVAVPATLDHVASPEAPAEPATNPAVNSQSVSQPDLQSIAALPHDDVQPPQPPTEDAPPVAPVGAATNADANVSERIGEAKPNGSASSNDTTGAMAATKPAAPEQPTAASVPHHLAPQIRIVSREADNPASVTTSPAPTLARKGSKRRKLAVHLHQSHHFRRPRVHQVSSGRTRAFVQPSAYNQPTVTNYAPGGYAEPNGFVQPSFAFTPAAIKPRPARWRRLVKGSFGGASSQ
jgi:hypothetical protein